MTASILYEGNLRTQATHIQSNTVIHTDAPTDNKGKGEKFSPTDTVCVALGTCIITTMAIKATDMGIDLKGTTLDVTKHMLNEPRRIGEIDITLQMPESLHLDDKDKVILQKVGDNCPVAKSLSPDVKQHIEYRW